MRRLWRPRDVAADPKVAAGLPGWQSQAMLFPSVCFILFRLLTAVREDILAGDPMVRRRKRILVAFIGIGAASFLVLTVTRVVLPRRLFRRVVALSVPASVRRIKADASFDMSEHKYVLRFNIDEADLPAILATRPFKQVEDAEYDDGIFEYEVTPRFGRSFFLYRTFDGQHPPRWFRFTTGAGFKIYAVEQEKWGVIEYNLLLYHKESGQAYFIQYGLGGPTRLHIWVLAKVLRWAYLVFR